MAFRFIHTADIHLDSPLRSLALRDPALADLVSTATRRALVRIVDLCLEEQVDALLIAGDLYDGEQTSMKTARFLAEQMRRLHQAHVLVFIIRGNHDALSKITKLLQLPDSVTMFDAKAGAIDIVRQRDQFPVVVHGLSFAKPQAPESLVRHYRPPVADAVNIGLMHTSLAGSSGHDPYAPCSHADLHATGFHYWALGHIHKRSVVNGRGAIVMPGMPQGRDIGEAGAKTVSLVTIADDHTVTCQERVTSTAQFERVAVDVSRIEDWRTLPDVIEAALGAAQTATASEHLIARVSLTGDTPLAWRIRHDRELLLTDLQERAAAIGGCWIEKLETSCRAPGQNAIASGDPIVELHRLIHEAVLQSDGFRTEMDAAFKELRKHLPREAQNIFGGAEADFEQALASCAQEGVEDVIARLRSSEATS